MVFPDPIAGYLFGGKELARLAGPPIDHRVLSVLPFLCRLFEIQTMNRRLALTEGLAWMSGEQKRMIAMNLS